MAEGTGGLELNYSPGLDGWLAAQRVSLAFAIPPTLGGPGGRHLSPGT